jgi:hypothetical protein
VFSCFGGKKIVFGAGSGFKFQIATQPKIEWVILSFALNSTAVNSIVKMDAIR